MKKKKSLIIIVLILVIISVIVLILVNKKNDEKFKDNDVEKDRKGFSYIVCNSKSQESAENTWVKCSGTVYTFDSNDICIDCRIVYDFLTEEYVKLACENWERVSTIYNLKVQGTRVSYNMDFYIGDTKEKIKELLYESNNWDIIEY